MTFFWGTAMAIRVFAAAALVALVSAFAPESRAANFLELNFGLSGPRYDGTMPLCNDWMVTSEIQGRFSEKEGRFWNSALQISAIDEIRETALRPWHYAAIPRRFCQAVATVSDGTRRPIYYSVAESTGIIGVTWGVEWCVVGLDRNWAYNPTCKMARP
jgi:hypothetical protein